MGLSYDYDCASSILFCEEENIILGFDGEEEGEGGTHELTWPSAPEITGLDENPFMGPPLPLQSDECLDVLVEREPHHLPRSDYAHRLLTGSFDPSIRSNAIEWISKVHAQHGFGPLSAYLSVNYLDRFLSEYELPQGKAWMVQLLAVACLSLATKMEETQVPLPLHLQVWESMHVFESRTIKRMELLVLSTLKWRMLAATPFSFIDYFIHMFNDGASASSASISRSAEIILCIVKGIDFLAFKPSEIAAAVALSVLRESQMIKATKALACCKHVEMERVLRCYEMIQELILMRINPLKTVNPSVSSVPLSPNGVLDADCLSYGSDEISVVSQADSLHSSPVAKRRKIS